MMKMDLSPLAWRMAETGTLLLSLGSAETAVAAEEDIVKPLAGRRIAGECLEL
jgi:hypothetical protein